MQNPWLDKYHHRDQADKSVTDTFDAFIDLSDSIETHFDESKAWKRITSRLELEQTPKITRIGYTRSMFLRVAAVFVLVALSFMFYKIFLDNAPEMVAIQAVSQPVNHKLPDGSSVFLDSYSSINYPADFSERVVEFEGTGYYHVVKAGSNFTVVVGDIKVEVLGTQFTLSSDEDQLKTYVEEGKVQVSSGKEAAKVGPGEILSYTKADQKFDLSRNKDPNILSWKTGKFVFKNSPLSEVFSQLQKHYKIEFRNTDQFHQCRVTAEFDQEQLSDVLNILGEIVDIKFNISGTTIKTVGKGCP